MHLSEQNFFMFFYQKNLFLLLSISMHHYYKRADVCKYNDYTKFIYSTNFHNKYFDIQQFFHNFVSKE